VAVAASAIAAYACVSTWQADFRLDLPKIDIPVLVIQGDADRILPSEKTGKRLPGLIADMELVAVEGGPHAIPWTHSDQVTTPCSASSAIRRRSRPGAASSPAEAAIAWFSLGSVQDPDDKEHAMAAGPSIDVTAITVQ
jgi:hypothetical protein